MREFTLNAAELLDKDALEQMRRQTDTGLLPCNCVKYNDKVRLVFYPEELRTLADVLPELSLEELCRIAESMLERTQRMLRFPELSPENVIWDLDSVYTNEYLEAFFIRLPAVVPEDTLQEKIYARRLYALLEDIFAQAPRGEEVVRQIRYQKDKSFGDWSSLGKALRKRTPEEYEVLVLRSVNTPRPLTFRIGHDSFLIGSETGVADGLILGVENIAGQHAEIGWNGICYYIRDLGSDSGTFVNDQRIVPGAEVPIGQGTVLRFADSTFTAE